MRRTFVLLTAAALIVLPGSTAWSIVNGVPDGNRHPNVGVIIFYVDPDGSGPGEPFYDWFCSGSLLTMDIFLTAGHCTSPMDGWRDEGVLLGVYVTFESDLHLTQSGSIAPDLDALVPVSDWRTDPRWWCNSSTCYYDLGVLFLSEPVDGIDPIDLPRAGFLTGKATNGGLRGHAFVNVGYGLQALDRSYFSPNVRVGFSGLREMSTSPFMALSKTHLFLLEETSATGRGGICFGDSGSPKFYAATGSRRNLVVTVTTSSDPKCEALSQSWRLDTAAARTFLDDYVTLP